MKAAEISHLTKYYGKNRGVIDVSFDIEQGEIFGFLGPNGAGKSTTIRAMLNLINYREGSIKLLGNDPRREHESVMREVGYIPSEAWFYPDATVIDILKMAEKAHGASCEDERAILCKELQLDTRRKISELSLGNRKKVSIVCSMQHKPKLFVFDEPTSGLDPLMQATFFALVKRYTEQGATCLLSTHILPEVRNHCSRAAIMRNGQLIKIDTVDKLTKSSTKRIRMIRDGEQLDYIYSGDLNELYKELTGHNIKDLLIEDPPLEDIFMHYYGGN